MKSARAKLSNFFDFQGITLRMVCRLVEPGKNESSPNKVDFAFGIIQTLREEQDKQAG